MEYENNIYFDKSSLFLTKRNIEFKKVNSNVDIVQIGDSITACWNLSRYFPLNKVVINSGIGGDNTTFLLNRINRDCLDYNPKKIILMIGINDIRECFKENHFLELKEKKLLIKLVSQNIISFINLCNDIQIIWCEILPVNEEKLNSYQLNLVIESVNSVVRNKIIEYKNVTVLKFDELQVYDGRLDKNLTDDGLHPNDDGYSRMSHKIKLVL